MNNDRGNFNMSDKQKNNNEFLIKDGNGFGITEDISDGYDGFYIFYLWQKDVSVCFCREEMYDFMELMTDKQTQAIFREEMGKIRLLFDIEERVTEDLEEGKNKMEQN